MCYWAKLTNSVAMLPWTKFSLTFSFVPLVGLILKGVRYPKSNRFFVVPNMDFTPPPIQISPHSIHHTILFAYKQNGTHLRKSVTLSAGYQPGKKDALTIDYMWRTFNANQRWKIKRKKTEDRLSILQCLSREYERRTDMIKINQGCGDILPTPCTKKQHCC